MRVGAGQCCPNAPYPHVLLDEEQQENHLIKGKNILQFLTLSQMTFFVHEHVFALARLRGSKERRRRQQHVQRKGNLKAWDNKRLTRKA